MTDQELNELLADALGVPRGGYGFSGPRLQDDDGFWTVAFSPATSVDDLRKWVLPEVERRGRVALFGIYMSRRLALECGVWWDDWMSILSSDPAVLAAAALEVLEADNA